MPAPIVFFDIASTDTDALKTFYSKVSGWSGDAQGQFEAPAVAPLRATIRNDPAEMRLYVGVPDVAGTLDLIEAHGGTVDAPRFEVPGVVVLGLFKDPAGNPLGLVEMNGDVVRVP